MPLNPLRVKFHADNTKLSWPERLGCQCIKVSYPVRIFRFVGYVCYNSVILPNFVASVCNNQRRKMGNRTKTSKILEDSVFVYLFLAHFNMLHELKDVLWINSCVHIKNKGSGRFYDVDL